MLRQTSKQGEIEMAGDDYVDEVFKYTNAERENNGLLPLTLNPLLTKAAQAHSEDMANRKKMGHRGSDGSSSSERIKRAGYKGSITAENVASGQDTPEDVVTSWMDSDGHRENILDPDLQEIGVGRAVSKKNRYYWTQNFGTPADGSPKSDPSPAPGSGTTPGTGRTPGTGTTPGSGTTPGTGTTPPLPSPVKPQPYQWQPLTDADQKSLAVKITDHALVSAFCLKTANEQFGQYCQTEESLISLAVALYTEAVKRD